MPRNTRPAPTQPVPATGREAVWPLDRLFLDVDNPRFGGVLGANKDQAVVLDFIVDRFGIDDVLSSLAVNGYFEAEPLVCRQIPGLGDRAVVAEGNRRLAACLILAGDPRSARQTKRAEQFQAIWRRHGSLRIDPVPIILFPADRTKALLSYLGVRHIAASQPWDSYAKAAWVSVVVENEGLEVADVALMIGDQHGTIARLLEGYYLVTQAVRDGGFRPADSVRRGRGSVSEYPFSWVYTILGYTTVRRYLMIGEDAVRPNPVPEAARPRAALVLSSMFGDRARGRHSAISASRELGQLASAVGGPEEVAMLEAGKSIAEIDRATKPLEERLGQGLAEVRVIQADLLAALTEHSVPQDVAEPLIGLTVRNRRTATEIERQIKEAASEDAADAE